MRKKHIRCLNCKSLKTRRNGKKKLKMRLIQRFYCLDCRKSFVIRLNKKSRITFHKKVEITRRHLEGRSSIRIIARHTGHSTKTICNSIKEITSQCVGASWIAKNLSPQWSGYLALDGKMIRVWDWAAKHFRYSKQEKRWLHKMSLLIALDLGTLDIPIHHLGSEETTIDLVLMLKELKKIGYPLKGYITDGNEDIKKAVEMVFGKIPRQLCIRHYLQNLRDKLKENKLSNQQYQDVCQTLLNGNRPRSFKVPNDLFTYRKIRNLPATNQQIENLIRYFNLRLKTINQFQDWKTAKHYLNALILSRRFTKFTDCRDKTKNHKAPLQLAGCDIKNLNYLFLKNNT